MTNILVFGDSITYGAWDKEGGWVQRLRRIIDQKNLTDSDFYCLISNLGIPGDTSEDLLRRFESETKERVKEDEETVIIFSVGSNDSQFVYGKNKIQKQEFQENLQKLIGLAGKFSSKIIFIGLFPVDDSKTMPIPWDAAKSYKNEYIKQYNEIIKSVCKKNKIHFIEIFENFIKLNYQQLLEDGLHPNSEGHEKIFHVVKDFLIEKEITK